MNKKKLLAIAISFIFIISSNSMTVYASDEMKFNTESFFSNVMEACGSTLYVWGGGWDETDTGSGETTFLPGAYPKWKEYFDENRIGYNFRPGQKIWKAGNHSARFDGLDCSGLIGWAVYNGIEGKRDSAGYVTKSKEIAKSLEKRGYGALSDARNAKLRPGDIISLKNAGHCYICLGVCSDKSVLLLHSTPNGGVQVSGLSFDGSDTIASNLAKDYMKKNYPDWWESFGAEGTYKKDAATYLNASCFSWDESLINDSKGIRNYSGEEMLDYLDNMENITLSDLVMERVEEILDLYYN